MQQHRFAHVGATSSSGILRFLSPSSIIRTDIWIQNEHLLQGKKNWTSTFNLDIFFSIFKNEYLFCSPWLLWVECSIYPTSDNKCGPTTIFRWINHCFFLDMERYGRNANREIKCKKLSCVGCLETCQCVKMRKFHILKLSSVNLFWVTKQNANIKFKPAEV